MPCISYPDIALLWKLYQTQQYGFAKIKLQHAMEHLEEVYEAERMASDKIGGCLIWVGDDF